MSTLADLKRKSADLSGLKAHAQKATNKFQREDEDESFWTVTQDKAGNGSATIRFLPASPKDGEDGQPFVRVFHHNFKGPAGWYIENSLRTHEGTDPCNEFNNKMWAGDAAQKKFVQDFSRQKAKFYSNILVVSDSGHPENNGKVFLFKYGKEIFDKIVGQMEPKFANIAACNPFDAWTGKDFYLNVYKNASDFNKYDQAKFADNQSPISNDDNKIEAIWNATYSLKEFDAPGKFKTYEELKAKLDKALGHMADRTGPSESLRQTQENPPIQLNNSTPQAEGPKARATVHENAEAPKPTIPVSQQQKAGEDEEDEALALFANLARGG